MNIKCLFGLHEYIYTKNVEDSYLLSPDLGFDDDLVRYCKASFSHITRTCDKCNKFQELYKRNIAAISGYPVGWITIKKLIWRSQQ